MLLTDTLVSIVVPVYNSSCFLRQCLDSLLNQSYSNIEVLCVNDGSTDNSLEIINEYVAKDKRVKVFTKKNEGKGAASARNFGLKNATGKYIQFLDSDDFFELDMIETLVRQAEEKNADIIICKANKFDNIMQKITGLYVGMEFQHAPENMPFSYKDCPEQIFQIGHLVTWNKLYRKELLDKYNLRFESIAIIDDQYVPALALVLAERISIVDRAFINYRINTGQSQGDAIPKHPETVYLATYSVVEEMRKYNIYDEVKRSYLNLVMLVMRDYFDKMTEYRTIKLLYDAYLNEVFPKLDADNLPKDYFYDERMGEWYELLKNNSLEEILFNASRAYGGNRNTAILRFQVPYEQIVRGSRIVIVGKKFISKYWHAQLILSEYCQVVCCVTNEAEIPAELEYDAIITAK